MSSIVFYLSFIISISTIYRPTAALWMGKYIFPQAEISLCLSVIVHFQISVLQMWTISFHDVCKFVNNVLKQPIKWFADA